MFLSHSLYVSLILFSLAVFSLAASRIGKESIDELDKLYIRSSLRSTSSIEEGEIGYSSDEFADGLEEGEIRDTEQPCDGQVLPIWNAIEQEDDGDVLTSSSGWQDWQHWGPPDSSTWEHYSEPDWEEGEIRDYSDSEMWHDDDAIGAEDTTLSADYEDSNVYRHYDAPHRSVSSFYDSTTTSVEETAKRDSLLSDILSRPAMPFIPSNSHNKEAAKTISRARLSLSSVASVIKSAIRGTSSGTPTSRYRDDIHGQAESSHQAGSSRKTSTTTSKSTSNLSFDFDDTGMTVKAKQRRQRAIFERIWRDKGISYDMSPQEVALGVAKIKIEYGHDLSLGTMASIKVQSETDEDYFNQFQLATRSYSRRLSQEKNKLKTEAKYFHFTEWEKKKFLMKQVAKYEPRMYSERRTKSKTSIEQDMRLDTMAKEVWKLFLKHVRSTLNNPALQEEELSIKQVEFYSRDLKFGLEDQKQAVELLKRYMIRFMRKSRDDIKAFSIHRLHYRYEQNILKQREREKKRRQDLGLRPTAAGWKRKMSRDPRQ